MCKVCLHLLLKRRARLKRLANLIHKSRQAKTFKLGAAISPVKGRGRQTRHDDGCFSIQAMCERTYGKQGHTALESVLGRDKSSQWKMCTNHELVLVSKMYLGTPVDCRPFSSTVTLPNWTAITRTPMYMSDILTLHTIMIRTHFPLETFVSSYFSFKSSVVEKEEDDRKVGR